MKALSLAVAATLLRFAQDYMAIQGRPNRAGYNPHAVVERQALCWRTLDTMPRTIEFAALRAYVRRISCHEMMADYEDDVREARYASAGEQP